MITYLASTASDVVLKGSGDKRQCGPASSSVVPTCRSHFESQCIAEICNTKLGEYAKKLKC